MNDEDDVARWRYDPTKTFYLGLFMGLIPFVLTIVGILLFVPIP